MKRFRGRKFSIGRHRPSFLGVRKKVAEKRGKPLPRKGTIARFLRSATSLSNASALAGSAGTGVTRNGAGDGGGAVNSRRYPSSIVDRIHRSPVIRPTRRQKPEASPPLPGPTQGGTDSACSHLRKGLPLPRPLPNLAGGGPFGGPSLGLVEPPGLGRCGRPRRT